MLGEGSFPVQKPFPEMKPALGSLSELPKPFTERTWCLSTSFLWSLFSSSLSCNSFFADEIYCVGVWEPGSETDYTSSGVSAVWRILIKQLLSKNKTLIFQINF